MKYVLPIITAVLAGALIFCLMRYQTSAKSGVAAQRELAYTKEAVEKRFREKAADIVERLTAFSQEVASDQLFSLRLLVENNPSAPEVTGKAGQFLKPMGFSLLDITDSSFVILSSGGFPASAGNGSAQRGAALSGEPKFLNDNLMGQSVLSLQAKREFAIAGTIRFYVLGGVIVDDRFLASLSPGAGIRVLLQQGTSVMGMPGVRAISDVKNGKIIINDKEYPAFRMDVPFAGEGQPPAFIVVVERGGV